MLHLELFLSDITNMMYWERVKEVIQAQNTTQEWVSKKSQIKFGTFRGWITKNRLPNADQAVSIAQALDTTVEYLVTGTDYTDPWIRENQNIIIYCKQLSPEALKLLKVQLKAQAEAMGKVGAEGNKAIS